jgi:hypothetical protein
MDGERTLWVSVVLQASEDLDTCDRLTLDYAQALSFFFGRGDWRRSRADIAECVGLHVDDLQRLGRQTLAARRLREGEPAVTPASDPVPVIVHPLALTVTPGADTPLKRGRPRNPSVARDRNWWIQDFLRKNAA